MTIFRFEITIILPDTRHHLEFDKRFKDWNDVHEFMRGLTIDPRGVLDRITTDTPVFYISRNLLEHSIITIVKVK